MSGASAATQTDIMEKTTSEEKINDLDKNTVEVQWEEPYELTLGDLERVFK